MDKYDQAIEFLKGVEPGSYFDECAELMEELVAQVDESKPNRFQPSPELAAPAANVALVVLCADTEAKAEQLRKAALMQFLRFEQEITLLTVRQAQGPTLFCPPIGHLQERGDYQCSWQPAHLDWPQLAAAQAMARTITDNLGGTGLFGVEFFLSQGEDGPEVIFSELSPRPHDTGLVTLVGQNLSEFELHLRAVLELPIPEIRLASAAASRVILAELACEPAAFLGLEEALAEDDTQVLLFGKAEARPQRRMGVVLAGGTSPEQARERADRAAARIAVVKGA
jgi:phosphoribosylglycinamide formyltransferase 2